MAVPFLEQCIAYDKVMGHSEVKEPTTLVISFTISKATMDFLKPISSPAYVTIPVATRNKNLTKRDLGYARIQLVISALRPLIVPVFILPARNSSFSVWILFFLRRSHNSPQWQDRPRSCLPAQPRPGPAVTRLLVPALVEISIRPVIRKEWGEVFLHVGHPLTLTTT